jgi:hypothetical protein
MTRNVVPLLVVLALGLAGCVSIPTGPSRMAMPGTGKDFDQFRGDDAVCRQYALETSGVSPTYAQEDSAVKSAAIGTVVGAAAGAAFGGSQGAAAGAGVGLLMGALTGAAAGNQSGYVVQQRYDNGYSQCMYAKGHRVAVPAGTTYSRPTAQVQPVQQPYYAPPAPSSGPPPQAQAPSSTSPPPAGPGYYGGPPPPGSPPPPPSAIVR